jgi:hypothetical protein
LRLNCCQPKTPPQCLRGRPGKNHQAPGLSGRNSTLLSRKRSDRTLTRCATSLQCVLPYPGLCHIILHRCANSCSLAHVVLQLTMYCWVVCMWVRAYASRYSTTRRIKEKCVTCTCRSRATCTSSILAFDAARVHGIVAGTSMTRVGRPLWRAGSTCLPGWLSVTPPFLLLLLLLSLPHTHSLSFIEISLEITQKTAKLRRCLFENAESFTRSIHECFGPVSGEMRRRRQCKGRLVW